MLLDRTIRDDASPVHRQPSPPSVQRLEHQGKIAGPKGAPPTIPPIIINPFSYKTPAPAIDPRPPTPSPPVAPPPRPAMSLEFAW
jgi:hypothetical protein